MPRRGMLEMIEILKVKREVILYCSSTLTQEKERSSVAPSR
jgi:hypothetical protein